MSLGSSCERAKGASWLNDLCRMGDPWALKVKADNALDVDEYMARLAKNSKHNRAETERLTTKLADMKAERLKQEAEDRKADDEIESDLEDEDRNPTFEEKPEQPGDESIKRNFVDQFGVRTPVKPVTVFQPPEDCSTDCPAETAKAMKYCQEKGLDPATYLPLFRSIRPYFKR